MANPEPKNIKLSRILKENLIDLDLKEKNKSKIILKLVDLVASSGKIKNKKAFLRAILEREKLGSTGIGNGVAIPHGKSKATKDFVLAFAKSKEGVDFGALDGEKVYLFFILASPQESVGGHLKILAKISYLIKDKFIIELLKRTESKKEIMKIILSQEKANEPGKVN